MVYVVKLFHAGRTPRGETTTFERAAGGGMDLTYTQSDIGRSGWQ